MNKRQTISLAINQSDNLLVAMGNKLFKMWVFGRHRTRGIIPLLQVPSNFSQVAGIYTDFTMVLVEKLFAH